DTAFHPPIGPELASWGVETMPGFRASNLDPAPDLVVVGNVCRRDNPEAQAALELGLPTVSFPGALESMFLTERRSFVVAGTHGKTTTTALVAHLLNASGLDPGLLVGGLPRNFDSSFRLGHEGGPFVIEGDEYDSAYFEKSPKFWRYRPHAVILTSIEHDHIDIYPDERAYVAAYDGLVERIPEDGLLVAFAGDPLVREVAARARCRVITYALSDDDCGDVAPLWTAAAAPPLGGSVPFDLFGGGSFLGRAHSPLSGRHNLRNTLAALALAAEGAHADLAGLLRALGSFLGVKRRQELLGVVDGVRVYEDFAHHPTAVEETLRGLRERHPEGRLLCAFEPRSATASRRTHEAAYPAAFRFADLSLIAPVGRPEIPDAERLCVQSVARAIASRGREAAAPPSIEDCARSLVAASAPGDTIVLMSNGPFGGIYDQVLTGLAERRIARRGSAR
ncbi:MAG: UDP-N-acetylmuramate:L-alanyl-gamma-D-glutamyl-meso-diaminopimelate ligase, partial [Polyangiaceae bacterium]|nr:UDP-N-acetylmuramate:L-alanyl-gamma-D-glutamyl-meso-diaminopimelate ligase [Polyangiaceae bacterium]